MNGMVAYAGIPHCICNGYPCGDCKSPMYFIAVACVANIVLDYLFMGAFGLGPAGAVGIVEKIISFQNRHQQNVTSALPFY